jgi:hypothetical protein
MGDFEFDIELLISLVETKPVFGDKRDDIYTGRIETKKTWTEVCFFPQEDFEDPGDVIKRCL